MYGRSYNWGDLPESRLNDYTKQHNGKRRNICRGTFDIFNYKKMVDFQPSLNLLD